MNKFVFFTAVAVIVATPGLAFGQSNMGRSDHAAGDNSGMMGRQHHRRSLESANGAGGQGDGQQFQQHKTIMMKRVNERMSRMQARQNCVQSASNRQAMAACLPTQRKNYRGGNGEGQNQ
jgi:hypothetical protein